jgi:hypothetical protein
MGSRWRQENYFRYARMLFDLDSHATTEDAPTRLVPDPAKKRAHRAVLSANARYEGGAGPHGRRPAGSEVPETG